MMTKSKINYVSMQGFTCSVHMVWMCATAKKKLSVFIVGSEVNFSVQCVRNSNFSF